MSKVRVPLWGKPQGYTTVENAATVGATVGVNLFWQDGTLVTEESLVSQVPTTPTDTQPSGNPSLWELIVNVPANVQGVAALTTDGFVRRDAGGTWSASPIVNVDLSGANTSGLAEGSNLYYTNARADTRALLAVTAHEAKPDPHPQYTTSAEAQGIADASVAAHEAKSDPHPQYVDADDTIDGGNF